METNALIYILRTRLEMSDNNETKRRLLKELIKALERLRAYEQSL